METNIKAKLKLTNHLSNDELKTRLLAMGTKFNIASGSKEYLRHKYFSSIKKKSKRAFILNKLKEEGVDNEIITTQRKGLLLSKSKNFKISKKGKISKLSKEFNLNEQKDKNPKRKIFITPFDKKLKRRKNYFKAKSIMLQSSDYKISTYYINKSLLTSGKKAALMKETNFNDESTSPYSTNRSVINIMNNLKDKSYRQWNILIDNKYETVKNSNTYKRQVLKKELDYNQSIHNQRAEYFFLVILIFWILYIKHIY